MESTIQKLIQLILSKTKKVTIFRNNTGQAWAGRLVSRKGTRVILEDARPLHAGLCVGSSDLIGFTTVEITQEMVGQKLAVFTAIECKQGNRKPTSEQENFIRVVREAGGFAGVANSEDAALKIVHLQSPDNA
jgi:hypothetical protein